MVPGQPPDRFARTVAQELAQAFERDPALNVGEFLREQYGREAHPLFVLLADGREFNNGGGPAPAGMLAVARARLKNGLSERTGPGGSPRGPTAESPERLRRFDRPERVDQGDRPPGTGFRPMRPAPIIVNDKLAGVVVVPPRAPFGFLLARYAPTLALVALGALVVGTLLATVVIFGPARRRLKAVEVAARRLGGGDLTARAPAQGGDEVAAVASAFNTMADDLAVRAEALATSDRTRRQLLADVSHELTTPITAMRGYLDTLMMTEMQLDEPTRARYLGIVADETSRLERLIGDLLDLARLEGGGGTLAMELIAVEQLFGRVAARHERACLEPGAEIVRGDRDRLEQALQNLAANALRYSPPGTTIELRARPVSQGLAFTVTDHGPGIAPEHLPHVFDRFYKAEESRVSQHGRAPISHGSGLGLSIVKAIVERHGGHLTVQSTPGRTVFELVIPVR
jgi:signal transduction histidine kinase